MKNISVDIESYSSVNLQKAGVYKYAESFVWLQHRWWRGTIS